MSIKLILLVLITGAAARWSCGSKSTEPPDVNSREAPAPTDPPTTPRPTVTITTLVSIARWANGKTAYKCDAHTHGLTTTMVGTMSSTTQTFRFREIWVGIEAVPNDSDVPTPDIFQIGIKKPLLLEALRSRFGELWTDEDLEVTPIEDWYRPSSVPLPGSLFFRSIARCYDVTVEDTPIGFNLYSNIFEFVFPAMGTCTPHDTYLPLKNNGSVWFENPTAKEIEQPIILRNKGLFFKPQPHRHLSVQLRLLKEEETEEFVTNLGFNRYNILVHIRNAIIARFLTIKSSTSTGLTWAETDVDLKLPSLDFAFQVFLPGSNFTKITYPIHPNSAARFYQIIDTCGPYTVYLDHPHSRNYGLTKTCLPKTDEHKRHPIEGCEFCGNDECYNEVEFAREHGEYNNGE